MRHFKLPDQPTHQNLPDPHSDLVLTSQDVATQSISQSGATGVPSMRDTVPKDNFAEVERAARRKRHVRLFCFSCNRYEGHSVAAKSRIIYSFLVGFTFGLYYYLGRFSCHCCGSARLTRNDWLNPRFWYRTFRFGGVAKSKKASSKTRPRSRGQG